MTRSIKDILTDDGRQNGIVRDMPREEYFGLRRMNASCLVTGLLGSQDIDPAMIKETFEQSRPAPSQSLADSFDRGTLAHLILLQPEMIAGRIAVWEGGDRRGQEWEDFKAANDGRLIMKAADVRAVQYACREFRQVDAVNTLLVPCDVEVAVFAKEGAIHCMGMIDAVTKSGRCVILDPKTTSKGIDADSVRYAIKDFHYRERLGIYRRWYQMATGREVEAVYLIFLSLPPNRIGIRLVKLTTAALEWGEARMLAALAAVEECLANEKWPTFFANGIADVSPFEIGNSNNVTFNGEDISS